MEIEIPEFSMILLVGASGSGKSTFAKAHFKLTEILSSDTLRGMVSDDENNQMATDDAFELLHLIAAKRLTRGRLTVIDATNLRASARQPLLSLAAEHHAAVIALVFDLPEGLCLQRNRQRADRQIDPQAVSKQCSLLKRAAAELEHEGYQAVYTFSNTDDVDGASITRKRLPNNRRWDHGPFDIIGDVHGCADELEALLGRLGYVWQEQGESIYQRIYRHPEGRKAVFVGDLVDRGPRILDSVLLAHHMVEAGSALSVIGNHDDKFLRWLLGRRVKINNGLESTIAEVEALPPKEQAAVRRDLQAFFGSRPSHYVLDSGRLVVAHAGIRKSMIGRESDRIRDFTLYGDTTGEKDEYGLPVRLNWAEKYHGKAVIVYGHTPQARPQWQNRTINIDTGCVFGGSLTALRYPEMDLVSVPAAREYTPSRRPFLEEDKDEEENPIEQ